MKLKSILLTILFVLFLLGARNPKLFGETSLSPVLYLYFFMLCGLSFFHLSKQKIISEKQIYLLLLILCLLPSVIFSDFSDVAGLKLILFSSGLSGLIWLSSRVEKMSIWQAERYVRSIMIVLRGMVLLCVIFYFFAGSYAYPRNSTGLGAFLNHPQLLGMVICIIAFIEFYILLLKDGGKQSLFFLLLSIFVIYQTESRTSFLAFLLGCSFLMFRHSLIGMNFLKKKYFYKYAVLLTVLIVTLPLSINVFTTMISKHGRSDTNIAASLETSRLFLAKASIENFIENPIIGIGFQVSNGKYGSTPMKVTRIKIMNLPIQASVEKGVFLTAILEETGLLGFFGFLSFILLILAKGGWSDFGVGITITVLLMSFGESVLFSLGSIGLFCWMAIIIGNDIGNKI